MHAEDAVDGEVTDDAAAAKIADEDETIGASSEAEISFTFVQPADANIVKGMVLPIFAKK